MGITNLDYIELKKQLEEKGLLGYTLFYYFLNFLMNTMLLALLLVIVFYLDNWYATILMAIPIAFIGIQFGYLGHDAGHNAVSKNQFINDFMGQFCHSLVLGLSFSYWRDDHNKHHANPNHESIDPNMFDLYSFTEKKARERSGFGKLVTRYQSFLLIPASLMLFFIIRYDSVKYIFKNKKVIFLDLLLIIIHVLIFFVSAYYFIGFIQAIVLYLVVTLLMGVHFGFSFIPNHVGMPVLTGNEKLSFLEKQTITSRDIKSGKLLDIIFGGLNYQIEHHLFPNISRKNLRQIKNIVKDFCIKKVIPYKDETLLLAWKDIFTYLHNIGKSTNVKISILKTLRSMV